VFYFVLFLSLCIFLPSPIFSLFPYTTLFRSICMRFFSEEWREGSMEILLTVPLKDSQIIGGKYLSGIILLIFSLVPTFFYFITRSEEHTSELQSRFDFVCRLLLEKKKIFHNY